MTMPTSFPRDFPEVRFPAEFTALYSRPHAYYPTAHHASARAIGNPFGIIDDDGRVHNAWHDDAQRMVRAQIQSMRTSEQKAELGLAARKAALGDLVGGRMMMPGTTIEGAPVLAGRGGLSGGVMRTQAGQQYLKSKLQSRVQQYNRIDELATGKTPEALTPTEAQLSGDDAQVVALGRHLDSLNDALAVGLFDKNAVEEARGFLNSLASIGWKIPQNSITIMLREVTEYMNELGRAINVITPGQGGPGYQNSYRITGDRLKAAREVLLLLERSRAVLIELSRVSFMSPKERQAALRALGPRLRLSTRVQRTAAVQRALPTNDPTWGEQAAPLGPGGVFEAFPATQAQRVPQMEAVPGVPVPAEVPAPLAEPLARGQGRRGRGVRDSAPIRYRGARMYSKRGGCDDC